MSSPVQKARIFKGADDQWYARIVGWNNEIMWTTEGHKNRKDVTDLIVNSFGRVDIEIDRGTDER